jgi:hypothetical protein
MRRLNAFFLTVLVSLSALASANTDNVIRVLGVRTGPVDETFAEDQLNNIVTVWGNSFGLSNPLMTGIEIVNTIGLEVLSNASMSGTATTQLNTVYANSNQYIPIQE